VERILDLIGYAEDFIIVFSGIDPQELSIGPRSRFCNIDSFIVYLLILILAYILIFFVTIIIRVTVACHIH
jgi:hypothetical protein